MDNSPIHHIHMIKQNFQLFTESIHYMEIGKIQDPRSSSTSSPKQQTGTKCRIPHPWLRIKEDKIEAAILQQSTFNFEYLNI